MTTAILPTLNGSFLSWVTRQLAIYAAFAITSAVAFILGAAIYVWLVPVAVVPPSPMPQQREPLPKSDNEIQRQPVDFESDLIASMKRKQIVIYDAGQRPIGTISDAVVGKDGKFAAFKVKVQEGELTLPAKAFKWTREPGNGTPATFRATVSYKPGENSMNGLTEPDPVPGMNRPTDSPLVPARP